VLKTTLAGLRARKLRVFTTSFAVLLGVAFMAGSLVLTDTIAKTFDSMFADIYAGTDAYVRGHAVVENEFGDDSRTRLDTAVLEAVRNVDGVAVAEPNIQGYAQAVGKDGKAVGNPNQGAPTFGGNWTADPDLNPFDVVEGREPRADDEVVMDKLTADKGELAVGDTIDVLVKTGTEQVKLVGITKFGELDSPGGATFIGFTQATAERVITEPGLYNGVSVVAEPGVSQAEVRDRIAAALPADAVEVITGATLTEENQSDIKQGLSFFNTFIVTFAAVALFVGSFIIYNTFSIIVAQRSRETALLRAIGASRRQVLGSILLEALVVGLVASVLGVAGGLVMAQLLKALLAGFGLELPAGGVVLTARTVLTCLIIGVGVSLVSAVFPARRAAKVPPIEAMRAVAVEPSKGSRLRLVAGLVLTLLGAGLIALGVVGDGGVAVVGIGVPLTFIGVAVLGPILAKPVAGGLGSPLPALKGMTGTLARNNAIRNPKRTSATASALMIGVGLVTFIAVMATSAKANIDDMIDENFGADFVVDSGSFGFGGVSPALAAAVEELPEVGSVGSIRFGMVEIEDLAQQGVAIDPVDLPKMFDFEVVAGDLTALDATSIAVHEDYEDGTVGVGDTLTVTFPETGEQELTVAAVYAGGMFGQTLFGLDAWEANIADQFDAQLFILAADGVALADAKAAVEEVAKPYPTASVQDLSEFKEAQSAQINQILGLIYALLGLAVLIAVLGIANTLALSIFERTRELGLLRAVGMTRAQLRSTVRWESVLIALFGTGLGVVIGVVFGSAIILSFADEGMMAVQIPVGSLVVIALLAALCGVLAAVLPARRAAKLDVLGAIAAA
jgi:putative ABC transport system permease protein